MRKNILKNNGRAPLFTGIFKNFIENEPFVKLCSKKYFLLYKNFTNAEYSKRNLNRKRFA